MTTNRAVCTQSEQRDGLLRRLLRKESVWGYILIAPIVIRLAVFSAGPIIASFFLSMTEYPLVAPPTWAGAENYVKALQDPKVHAGLQNTLHYIALSVPTSLAISFMLAIALNQDVRGITVFRVLFFLPVVSSVVAVSLLWQWLYNGNGLFNYFLSLVGIPKVDWLGFKMALNSIILMSVWQSLGTLIVYWIAGLQSIPQVLYEAATIDGAGWWQRHRHVTVPLISPITFFLVVLGIIGSFQVFESTFIITEGGPGNSTLTLALYIYQQGFAWFHMGYASAIAWLLFALVLTFTIIQWRLRSRWVFYEVDRRG